MDSSVNVTLYGSGNCHKSKLYRRTLDEMGVPYHFLDVGTDTDAANAVRAYYGGKLHFPVFHIGKKWIRNPSEKELIQTLNRESVIDSGIIHDEKNQRFIKYMNPRDSFVSYQKNDNGITLSHIEVPIEKRGSGIGARVALQAFEVVEKLEIDARLTCPFLRRVAAKDPQWIKLFNL